MKILLVSDYSVPRGGNEVVTLSLRDGLRARGHDVRLFASRAYADAGAEPAEYGCFGTATPLRAALGAAIRPRFSAYAAPWPSSGPMSCTCDYFCLNCRR